MNGPTRANQTLIAIVIDLGLTLAALAFATEIRPLLPFGQRLTAAASEISPGVYALVAAIWLLVFVQLGMYSRHRSTKRESAAALTLAVFTALLILAGALYFTYRQVSRLQFVYFGALDWGFLVAVRAARRWVRHSRAATPRWRVLVVGSGKLAGALIAKLRTDTSRIAVLGVIAENTGAIDPDTAGQGVSLLGGLSDLTRIAEQHHPDEIIFAPDDRDRAQWLEAIAGLEETQVQISLVPDALQLAWFTTRLETVGGIPLLRLRESPLDGALRVVKRLMDISLSAALLLVSAPIGAVVALLVRLDSAGPVIIRQKRVGEGMRPFGMFKFRTMYAGEETRVPVDGRSARDGDIPAKTPVDPRVTRLGRVLRRFSIDELPQLLNVLRGEMSLVGPRPELPWLVDRYAAWQRRRFAVPPGMTGWWQISGRSERPMHLNVEDDLYYIRNYSLWLDVVILLRTIPVVLGGRGAY
ncbi:MAG: sugar transferase [Thermoflexales bacterium]|nr:sugar transferase [Thermoflexales bacterium]